MLRNIRPIELVYVKVIFYLCECYKILFKSEQTTIEYVMNYITGKRNML